MSIVCIINLWTKNYRFLPCARILSIINIPDEITMLSDAISIISYLLTKFLIVICVFSSTVRNRFIIKWFLALNFFWHRQKLLYLAEDMQSAKIIWFKAFHQCPCYVYTEGWRKMISIFDLKLFINAPDILSESSIPIIIILLLNYNYSAHISIELTRL